MRLLSELLDPAQIRLHEEFGLPSLGREAVYFALMGHEALHGRPNTVPSCTGASHAVVMGKLVPGANYRALHAAVGRPRRSHATARAGSIVALGHLAARREAAEEGFGGGLQVDGAVAVDRQERADLGHGGGIVGPAQADARRPACPWPRAIWPATAAPAAGPGRTCPAR